VSIGLLVVGLDTTILNVALPTIAASLDAGTAQLQWIVDAYVLAFAGGMLPAGLLGDRFGRRRVLLIGLGLFGSSSAACAVAGSAGELIAARIVLGAAAAMIMPLSIATVPVLFGPQERPRAIAAIMLAIGLGLPLGPIVGGVLLDHFAWNAVFWINVPVIALVLPAAALLLPETTNPEAPAVDALGVGFAVGAIVALVFGLVEAPTAGWASPRTIATFAVACLSAVAFMLRERRIASPLVDPGLFADRRFTWGTVAGVITMYALFGILFTVPQFLQAVLGHDALATGLRVVPLMIGLAAAAPLAGAVDRRWGTKVPIVAGLLLLSSALVALSRLTSHTDELALAGILAISGFGTGLAMIPAMDAVISAVPGGELGAGAAVNTTLRQLGGAVGVASLGSLLASVYRDRLDPAIEQLPPVAADAARGSVVGADTVADGLGVSGDVLRIAAHDAFTAGLTSVGLACAAVTLVGAVLVMMFLPARSTA
jgi:EmrB/QacA subfamily drug resistance transporter